MEQDNRTSGMTPEPSYGGSSMDDPFGVFTDAEILMETELKELRPQLTLEGAENGSGLEKTADQIRRIREQTDNIVLEGGSEGGTAASDQIRRIREETDNIQLDLDAMSLGQIPYEQIKPKFCLKCGAALLPNARFCIKCGTHVGHTGLSVYEDGEG
ncbi:MAG: zinc ribbon domain-containing protein [Lachnospiraceae bacterium]|nr:zinc ribbon domain-containing protein [Lachnospiraceae bacterium]